MEFFGARFFAYTKKKYCIKMQFKLDTRKIAVVFLGDPIKNKSFGVVWTTANVVLNTAFGWPTIAVDTHIFRVSNRTKLAPGKNVKEVEEKLIKVVPAEFKVDVHHWLILHGRYTCIARKPRCGSCVIEDLCEFKEKTSD
ncbi:endonuclease III-like iron-sulfur protein [Idiomarina loihiensis]|nr:endonuclease III-like iron-sulfur protein [Idiomarina loihiensis]TDP46476.1 endonuclease III-like iron-sulfur protein [Idiomarina loihiensis]TDS22916.1 endonuclease III-like iron-sulfur protein [Idiomarina sp. H2]